MWRSVTLICGALEEHVLTYLLNVPMNKSLNFDGNPDYGSLIRICIVTLVRRALAEVCTVPVRLVHDVVICKILRK